jgi:protein gp37
VSDKTKISWTDASWPVVTGCTHISEGCDNCYAARLTSGRLKHLPAYEGLAEHGRFNGHVRLLPDRLDWPAKWRKPRRIFVSDMADLFHDKVPDGFIARVWDVMGQNQQHTYQILTKRHARMKSWLTRWADQAGDGDSGRPDGFPPLPRGPEAVRGAYSSGRARLFADMLDSMGTPPEGCAYPLYDWMEGWRFWGRDLFNVWGGVSAENQKWFDIRGQALLDTPLAVRWVSCEPLLGPIDLTDCGGVNAIEKDWTGGPPPLAGTGARHPLVDWVVIGGESGPGHREMDVDWLVNLAGQCQDAGVPVFVKQDSGPRSGMQGRIPDDVWQLKQFPK